MIVLAYLYIAMFAFVSLWGIREDLRWNAPRWKAVLSVVGNSVGIAGLLLPCGFEARG